MEKSRPQPRQMAQILFQCSMAKDGRAHVQEEINSTFELDIGAVKVFRGLQLPLPHASSENFCPTENI